MIQKEPMFNTPKSMEDLLTWVQLHNPSDQIHILTGAMLAWNLACDIVQKEKDNAVSN